MAFVVPMAKTDLLRLLLPLLLLLLLLLLPLLLLADLLLLLAPIVASPAAERWPLALF